jgi:hypothetical protein
MKSTKIIITALSFMAACAHADVVPNLYESTAANASFLMFNAGARTYQYVIDESELTGLLGQNIVGLRMRLNESATAPGPSANMSTTDLEVWIGPGVDPSAMTTTAANNFTSAPTQVRDGAADFLAGSFGVGNPAPLGPPINLDEYLYSGGDLAILVTWQAWAGASLSFDAAGTTSSGYGTNFASRWIGGFNAAELTNNANFVVTDIMGRPVPEPGTFLAIGVGIALRAIRRRK